MSFIGRNCSQYPIFTISKYKAIVASTALLLTTAPVLAGQYELVKGKGVEVCEAYQQSLNSFQPKLPMVCGRAVSTKYGFDKPKWEQPENISLSAAFWDFSEYLWERDVNQGAYFERDKWKGTPAQIQQAHKHYRVNRERLWFDKPPVFADFDIDNDGNREPVYFQHPCGSVYGDLFAVLTPDYTKVDRTKTARLTPHPPFKQLGLGSYRPVKKGDWGIPPSYVKKGYIPVEDAVSDVHYDFFFFKGKTYFDQWWVSHPDYKGKSDIDAGLLRLFEPSPAGSAEICTYRFVR